MGPLALSTIAHGSERSQAIARLVLVTLAAIYTNAVAMMLGGSEPDLWFAAASAIAYLVFSVAIYFSLRFWPEPHIPRRILGIIGDLGVISFIMAINPTHGVLYPLYLWVIVGNGLRFGIRYLFFAMIVGAVGFSLVITTSVGWQQHFGIAIGLLIGVVALPLFYSTLLRELQTTNQKLADEMRKVAFAATHDALTGLANRSLFGDRLEHALAHARREKNMMAVLYLDLDGFKQVNDSLGHRVGDDLLTETARRLQQCVRDSDTVARMGGDEFTLLLEAIHHADEAALIAEKIIAQLSRPFLIDGHRLEVTASIGISVYPNDHKDGESLVQAADAAMYRAKADGGKRFAFHPSGAEG